MSDLVVTRSLVALPPGAAVARYISAFGANDGHLHKASVHAAQWKDTPQVANAFEYMMKAAVLPGTSTDGVWAAPLAQTSVGQEALSLLRGRSIVAMLAPRLRQVEFNQKVPRDATTATLAAWVAEAAPSPAAALSFSTVGPLPMTKAAVLLALTRELLLAGSPGSLRAINDAVIGGVSAFIDQSFLDPVSAAATGKPASVTNGATAITSTGATAAAITTDLNAMLAAITTTGGDLVWVMRPKTAAYIAGALGMMTGLPSALFGLPVVASSNSPQQVTLLDGRAILYADDGGIEIDLSQNMTVQMDTAPITPDATVVPMSAWQLNVIGIRAVRYIGWLRAVSGSVSYMITTY
jgi:HK97 family phage major capsid protein